MLNMSPISPDRPAYTSPSKSGQDERPNILVLVDGYLPGHKLGGPIRSVSALVERLSDEFDFRIITRDRDLGDTHAYANVAVDQWQFVGKAQVFYASPRTLARGRLATVLSLCPYDLLYCNSLFSPYLTLQVLALRRLRLITPSSVIVAPRGELSEGALALKRRKKATFLAGARIVGLYNDVIWHASTEYEYADIVAQFGIHGRRRSPIIIAPILAPLNGRVSHLPSPGKKKAGSLRAVFVSRISRKKNLDGALRVLARVPGRVDFTIYGPIEDPAYWAECQKLIARLPPTVSVSYKGALSHHDVPSVLAGAELFVLLTRGENFGHAILEAMASGCPVLISDQTAWRGLEAKGAGWDIALSDEHRIVEVLTECVLMDDSAHSAMSRAVMKLADAALNSSEALTRNRILFRRGLTGCSTETE